MLVPRTQDPQGRAEEDNADPECLLPRCSRAALSSGPSVLFLSSAPSSGFCIHHHTATALRQSSTSSQSPGLLNIPQSLSLAFTSFDIIDRVCLEILLSWATVAQYSAHSSCIFMAISSVFVLMLFVPPRSLNSGVPQALSSFYPTLFLQELYSLLSLYLSSS